MKTAIHPPYFDTAEILCSCGNRIVTGSTKEKLKTELCSKCHPFYTGQQKLVDTAGRVDRFEARRKKAVQMKQEAKREAEAKKKKPTAYQEKEVSAEVLERAFGEKKQKGKWGSPLGESLAEEVFKEEVIVAKKAKKAKKASGKKMVLKAVKKTTAKKRETKKAKKK